MTTGLSDRIAEVEAKSAGFRKELGLRDLVFTQIVYVVGTGWVGTAAKLGTDHVAFWLLAIALYYLPQAVVVIALARLMPVEGGLYQWAHEGLGRFLGFFTAWTIWAYTITVMAQFAIGIATNIAYLVGADAEWVSQTWWYLPVTSVATIVGVTGVSMLGLRVGKWLQNVGAAAHLVTFTALIIVPFVAVQRGVLADYAPLRATVPVVSLLSLNIFAKLALGALSGFEYVAILAGETRSPARTIGRSVATAVPIIAAMFILGTSSTLALVPHDKLDLVSPIPQTLTIGFAGLSFASAIVPALIAMVLLRQLGAVTLIFAGNTRLPMVAGWDGLLPAWFTRLHPRFGTPVNSVLFVGAITLAFCLLSQAGVGLQEAFQLIENLAGILYGLTYLALFAIPLVGARRLGWRPPLWLRIASASGFAVTLLYCVLSIFPIIDVDSWQVFALKIVIALGVVEARGVALDGRATWKLPAPESRK